MQTTSANALSSHTLSIEVRVARYQQHYCDTIAITPGVTVSELLQSLPLLWTLFPELPPIASLLTSGFAVTIDGQKVSLDQTITKGRFLELLWPLHQSAMDARRRRQTQAKGKTT